MTLGLARAGYRVVVTAARCASATFLTSRARGVPDFDMFNVEQNRRRTRTAGARGQVGYFGRLGEELVLEGTAN
jgi:hypothetical protein